MRIKLDLKNRPKPIVDLQHKHIRDAVALILLEDMKIQIAEGRPGPTSIDFEQVCDLMDKGLLKVCMKEGNPDYPELILDP